jgi:malate synthase
MELYQRLLSEEMEKIEAMAGAARFATGKYELARQLFDRIVTAKNFVEFLTLVAYERLE